MSDQTPLIEREIFFGNPLISGGQLSPDGQYITFIKAYEGVMNIWIKGINDSFDEALPLTNDKTRPITSYFWSRDSKYVLFVQDNKGDENYRVYKVNPSEAAKKSIPNASDLTPYDNIRAMIVSLPKSKPSKIIIGLNDRDNAWHDYYEINIENGERKLLIENNDQLNGVSCDLEGVPRLASRSLPNGGIEILKIEGNNLNKILESTLEESLSPIRFSKDGKVFFISNVGTPDLSGLYVYDLGKDEMTFLESDPEKKVDISNVSFSSRTDEIIATIYKADKKRIYWKNEDFKNDYEFLKTQFPNFEISISSTTKEEDIWIVYVNSDTDPGRAFLYYRDDRKLEFLYSPRPKIPVEHLNEMQAVRYKSSDGLEIPAYLTLPKDTDQKDLPTVIFVHGGPWARDHWGYNSYAQFLSNRGYAVLQPNFRGSTGYGKRFLNAAINEWGEKMQDDLTWGVKYLVEKGIADPKKVAIMGGSYGGYATLAGLVFTPDTYAAGVSIVGPSNLFTLLETIPPYWESARTMFHKRMGNPNTEEGKAQLKRQSPFFHAKNIQSPLLVAQGANDPRVKKSESDQIVIAMRDLNLPVEYLNFPDEGHGFANPNNNMAFVSVMEKFLAKHIGGRYQEKIDDKLQPIIDNVTVDIHQLEMPKLVSKDQYLKHFAISKPIIDSKVRYQLSLNIGGRDMLFDVNRSIKINGDDIHIQDNSESKMGSMNDSGHLLLENWRPVHRQVQQGPLALDIKFHESNIHIHSSVNGEEKDNELSNNNDFIMDGPSLDTFLVHQDLHPNFKIYFKMLDTTNQQFQGFSFEVIAEEHLLGFDTFKCQLQSIDGPDKSQTIWISKSDVPILVKKESTIAEMGGAKMTFSFNQFITH